MNKLAIKIVYSLLVLAVMVGNAGAQETGQSYIERELDYLMQIWPGDYDNQEQISLDALADGEEEQSDARFHAYIKHIELSELGEHVLFSEETREGLSSELFQQRVYVLSADDEARAIRVTSYAFKKTREVLGYQRDPDQFPQIKKKSLRLLEGCDMLLRRERRGFVGMFESTCTDSDLQGNLQRELVITQDDYSFKQRMVDTQGQQLSSVADYQPRVMRRARWFACMIDVPKTKPGVSNFTQHYMTIHDQGGTFSFVHPDGRNMTLLMRNTWSYGMQRETFFIGVLDGDVNGKTLVYSWGMPGADRIGMNPGWVRIQCDLNTARNVELQHGLRAES